MTLAEPARDIRIDERVISAITLNLQSNRVLEVALKKNVTLVNAKLTLHDMCNQMI